MGDTTIRIGQFTDSYPPIVNGVSAFVNEHHRELLVQGQQSFVFTFSRAYGDPEPGVYRTAGIPMGNFPFQVNVRLDRRASRAAYPLDIFHIHEPFVIANVALRVAKRRVRPIVYTNHTRHDIYVRNFPGLARPPLNIHVMRSVARLIRASDLATTPSEDSARWMRSLVPDLPPERVRVVRNGIHLSAFAQAEHPHSRAELGIPSENTVFIYVGRLTPEKNLLAFAEGFRRAVGGGANATWLLVGDGNERNKVEETLGMARSRAVFAGKQPREAIPGYLALADVFATASLSEANPVSVIEALACGKPYIGLKAPWWNEFIADRSAGLLVEHDADALAAAIRQLSDSTNLRAEFSVKARQISAQFDITAVTARWIELYATLIEQTTHRSMAS